MLLVLPPIRMHTSALFSISFSFFFLTPAKQNISRRFNLNVQLLRKSLDEACSARDAAADRCKRLSADGAEHCKKLEEAMVQRVGVLEHASALLREELTSAREGAAAAERRLEETMARISLRLSVSLCSATQRSHVHVVR